MSSSKTIEDTIGYVLVFTIIIISTLSGLLCGVVMPLYYVVEFIFNKIKKYIAPKEEAPKEEAPKEEVKEEVKEEEEEEVKEEKVKEEEVKEIIDDTWCNVSAKNIIQK